MRMVCGCVTGWGVGVGGSIGCTTIFVSHFTHTHTHTHTHTYIHTHQVVPSPPWTPPAAARLPVDGVLAGDTQEAFQQFVGLDVKADLGDVDFTLPRFQMMIARMTNYALAAFLNCAHQVYPHVVMGSFRAASDSQPLVKKLQHFLATYPQLTGAGGASADTTVTETGEMDPPTVRALQNLLNKCPLSQDFASAVAAFRP